MKEEEELMPDKNSWDIRQLNREIEESRRVEKDHEERIRKNEAFRTSTVERLIIVFDRLDELAEGDKWIKRLIITALVTGVIGSVMSLIVWAIQN